MQSPVSGYKIKDLIHSTQEEDLKILGINRKDAKYSLKDDFGREDIKAERLARMTLRALDEGVNPDAVTECNGVEMMGSRTNKSMAEIGKILENQEMTDEQRAVVDVYSGRRNNVAIEVERSDGKRRIILRQGKEPDAGTKYSVMHHYKKTEGVFTADDVLQIPKVIRSGEITPKVRRGKQVYEYKLKAENGTTYTVVTELNKGREEFADFYTDKKASSIARSTHSEEARADIDNAQSVRKDTPEFSVVQGVGVESGADAGEQYSLKDAESVRDVVLETIPKLDESNKGDKNARVAAMKAIGGNLSKLRQAMGLPRHFVPLPLIKRENWVGVDNRC